MTKFRLAVPLGVLVLLALLPGGRAEASSACIKEARADNRACMKTCTEEKQTAKDACLNRDHACVEVCRANRSECHEATGLEEDLAACSDTLEAARQACRAQFLPDTPERDACIDQVQVVAFECRDAAREVGKPLAKICRSEFKSCAKACGPPDPLHPVDTRQCRIDAKNAYDGCKDVCIEDYQLAKDTCKNRDHECVEACRESRHACKAPVIATLEAAKAVCADARDAAVDNCRVAFAPDSPELDTCIDQAQVDAFRCRDDAREVAHPGLSDCREDFRACAQACPPPAES